MAVEQVKVRSNLSGQCSVLQALSTQAAKAEGPLVVKGDYSVVLSKAFWIFSRYASYSASPDPSSLPCCMPQGTGLSRLRLPAPDPWHLHGFDKTHWQEIRGLDERKISVFLPLFLAPVIVWWQLPPSLITAPASDPSRTPGLWKQGFSSLRF